MENQVQVHKPKTPKFIRKACIGKSAFNPIARHPWSVNVDGRVWTIGTNEAALVAVERDCGEPELTSEQDRGGLVARLLRSHTENPQTFSVAGLKQLCREDRKREKAGDYSKPIGVIAGVPVMLKNLGRALKGWPDGQVRAGFITAPVDSSARILILEADITPQISRRLALMQARRVSMDEAMTLQVEACWYVVDDPETVTLAEPVVPGGTANAK